MTEAIVHIGAPKTGISTLKQFIATNAALLRERGIVIPSGAPFFSYAVEDEKLFARFQRNLEAPREQVSYRAWLREDLPRQLERANPRTIVVLNERLYGRLRTTEEIERLRELLATFCTNVVISCYVRRQDEILLSLHSHLIRRGLDADLAASPAQTLLARYDYYERLTKWADVFGRKALRIRRWGPAYFDGGDLVSDFASTLGMEHGEKTPRRNESPSADRLEFLRLLNVHISAWPPEQRKRLAEVLCACGTTPKFGLSEADRKKVVAPFEDSNLALAKEFLGLEGPLFTHAFPDDPPTPLTMDQAIRCAGEMAQSFITPAES